MTKRQPATTGKSRSGLALVMEGTVRIAPLQAIPQLLGEMGQEPAKAVAEAGLDLPMFDDPESTLMLRKPVACSASVWRERAASILDCWSDSARGSNRWVSSGS